MYATTKEKKELPRRGVERGGDGDLGGGEWRWRGEAKVVMVVLRDMYVHS
jgi:hypothetical protein